MKKKYRAYSIFDSKLGEWECAMLVFAGSGREAKRLAYRTGIGYFIDHYTDMAFRWIRNSHNVFPLGNQEKIKNEIPHVVADPVSCESCEHWGAGLDKNGKCSSCGEDAGEKLVRLLA
jgi:hypothetical protein